MIIPQASIGGKVKGNSAQYHANVSRDEGKTLYDTFIEECKKSCQQQEKTFQFNIVNGTYGNRQGLKFESDGPFTHLIEL